MVFSLRGQGFLGMVILVGGIMLATGIAFSIVVLSVVNSEYGYQAAERAQMAALAGVQDALLQLNRNTSFSSAGYLLPIGSSTATVSVTQSSPSVGYATILSISTVSGSTRKLNVVVLEGNSLGGTSVVSWTNIP